MEAPRRLNSAGVVRGTNPLDLEKGIYPYYSKDMAKVTSKRQVTVPKALADQYGIEPGVELDWQAAGDVIRVIPPGRQTPQLSTETRLELFRAATERQRQRELDSPIRPGEGADRGWARDELYDRDHSPQADGPTQAQD